MRFGNSDGINFMICVSGRSKLYITSTKILTVFRGIKITAKNVTWVITVLSHEVNMIEVESYTLAGCFAV